MPLVFFNSLQGNRICDICKTVVKNLPEVTPRAPDSATTQNGNNAFDESDAARNSAHLFAADQVPGGADVVFDCIRVSSPPDADASSYSLQAK